MNLAKSILLSLLFIVSACVSAVMAQQPSTATATVSGRVRVESEALAGIQLMLQQEREGIDMLNQMPPLTTVTDAEGNYRFTNVPAGKYRLQVYAPVYVNEQGDEPFNRGRPVNVAEGETIENLNFTMRRGGVITGNVTDEDGRPMIEESISLFRVDEQGKKSPVGGAQFTSMSLGGLPADSVRDRTDDRGIYRWFGLEPGRYLVAAGGEQHVSTLFDLSKDYQQTYYPRTTNQAEAKPVEVRAGGEVEGIDIVLTRSTAKKGFAASGRVIETETGKPVPGVMIAYESKARSEGAMPVGMMPATTNSQGEFRLEGLKPGAYVASVLNFQAMMGGGSDLYAAPLDFEIGGSDLSGLEIKMSKGTAISGRVALEGAQDPTLLSKLTSVMVQVLPEREPNDQAAPILAFVPAMGMVKPDRTFRIGGVRAGKVRLEAHSMTEQALQLVRMERNGVPVSELVVSAAEPITDLRLIFAFGSASIVGRVEVRGGTLPPGAKIAIRVERKDTANPERGHHFAEADARGQFSFGGVIPGVYEIVAEIIASDHTPVKSASAKQTVTVADKARQEVVLNVEVNPKEKDR
jgi:protocatechuate 3,4-dioxygenase beta subunit